MGLIMARPYLGAELMLSQVNGLKGFYDRTLVFSGVLLEAANIYKKP
jgi:hypothetical protein